MKNLLYVLVIIFFSSCSNHNKSRAEFLIGEWKIEEKQQYEVWKKNEQDELSGSVYRIENGEKAILETLRIFNSEEFMILVATVPSQNNGEPVPFVLNNQVTDYLSFENMDHDFPKKIQYEKIHRDTICVRVLGEHDKGFTYKQLRQL